MLDGKTIIVTGAAGALGREVVLKLNALNACLILVDRLPPAAAFPELAGDARHLMLEGDVSDEVAMRQLVDRAVIHCGAIDGVLHLAGGFTMGEAVSELSRETWDAMMTLNAWSFIALSRAVVPHMRVRGGAIVAVSARAAARGEANMAAYCAAKSALQRLVESLSAEVREHGIRVNSVAPSIIDTPANRQAMPDADPSRWVSREGLAGTLAFLLSDAARDIHGTHLVVSGLC
ncbi:MAG: SDR family oxidoreductase [Thauera sp.]